MGIFNFLIFYVDLIIMNDISSYAISLSSLFFIYITLLYYVG